MGRAMTTSANIDPKTVEGFGQEWAAYDQSTLDDDEYQRLFDGYFSIFSFDPEGEGFDLGCGSGRWAKLVAPRVRHLHCIDAAAEALAVARRNLAGQGNVSFHHAPSHAIPLADSSQDFGYSLGVLHHIPDTEAAMRDCVRKLKPGAQFLVYLYYGFDNRPGWFRTVWKASDVVRKGVSRLPFGARKAVSTALAATVYFPLARLAGLLEGAGVNAVNLPLYSYRKSTFYSMRTDALDRFGTRLEQRFTRAQITAMMTRCGLEDIRFSDDEPYWVAVGRKRK
jgi:SAM-dependent methyltransferase